MVKLKKLINNNILLDIKLVYINLPIGNANGTYYLYQIDIQDEYYNVVKYDQFLLQANIYLFLFILNFINIAIGNDGIN